MQDFADIVCLLERDHAIHGEHGACLKPLKAFVNRSRETVNFKGMPLRKVVLHNCEGVFKGVAAVNDSGKVSFNGQFQKIGEHYSLFGPVAEIIVIVQADFANGLDGWFGTDKDTAPNAEVWSIVEGVGPNGEKVIEAIAATDAMPLANSWTLDPGTYVVSYQIKATAATNVAAATISDGAVTYPANCAAFLISTTGDLAPATSTADAPVTNVSSLTFVNDEWKTVCYYFTIEEGQSLVMHFEKLATGMQITNIEIHQAQEVYDVRIAQNRIAYAKEVMENPNFNIEAAQEARAELENTYIAGIEGMIEAGEFDDASNAESMMAEFNEALET